MSGLYIHIPFCKTRCIYCGFYSTTSENLRKEYVDALCRELYERKQYIKDNVTTIYIGGGTPSQLSFDELDKIFNTIYQNYHIENPDGDNAPEITMECNPDDINADFASYIRSSPINRISMGAQSFSNDLLKFIHRRHTSEQISHAVNFIRNADISNISIDLMFGFPNESLDVWHNDLSHCVQLNIEHISAYSLMYEENTTLYKMLKEGKIKECSEDTYLYMYNDLIDTLSQSGYEHYEISNFAKPGYRSRHNSNYWKNVPYLGIGASAHSFNLKERQWNVSNVVKYINSINNGTIPAEIEVLTIDSHFDDFVMTSLRTCEGIDLKYIKNCFGDDYLKYLLKEANRHIKNGLLTLDQEGGRLILTRKGIFVSDDITADLMHV